MIEAGSLRNKDVYIKNKKVGVVQHVFFKDDPVNPVAMILVYPSEKNWFLRYLEDNLGRIGIDTLASFLPDLESEILNTVKEKGKDEAIKIWKAYLKNHPEKAQQCMFFPCNKIDESSSNGEKIPLKIEEKDIQEITYAGIPSSIRNRKDMFAFYEKSNLENKDQKSNLPVNLNKTFIHSKPVSDGLHDEGGISDILLDVVKGRVCSFVIDVMGEGAGERVVPFCDVDFDTQELRDNKFFKNYPLFGQTRLQPIPV
ncbi:MAG: hypothetical protein WC325_13955 [Candidatus Bathyarchaeia archaeon]|jgi:hypothetical protein